MFQTTNHMRTRGRTLKWMVDGKSHLEVDDDWWGTPYDLGNPQIVPQSFVRLSVCQRQLHKTSARQNVESMFLDSALHRGYEYHSGDM